MRVAFEVKRFAFVTKFSGEKLPLVVQLYDTIRCMEKNAHSNLKILLNIFGKQPL